MATMTVDVDLDTFDTSELISELEYRRYDKHHKLVSNDLIRLQRICNGTVNEKGFPGKISMINQQKIDLLILNIERISLDSLEKLINP